MMWVGRVLKRRWGVNLGADFQMLSLSTALFIGTSWIEIDPGQVTEKPTPAVALAEDKTTGVGVGTTATPPAPVATVVKPTDPVLAARNLLMAAMLIFTTIFIVKLINRFYWEGYFQRKRQMIVPRFLTHATMLIGLMISAFVVVQWVYGVNLRGLLVGGSIATAGIALALQSILKNLFAGFTLQMDKPYKPGDWLNIDGDMGQVMEINWRSTRLRTVDHIYIDLPNSDMITNKIVNLNYPVRLHAFRCTIPADYSSPPNKVRDILLNSVGHVDGVRQDPAPEVYVKDFDDRAAIYEIQYWIDEDEKMDRVADAIRTGAWYALHRAGMSIPWLEASRTIRTPPQRHRGPA